MMNLNQWAEKIQLLIEELGSKDVSFISEENKVLRHTNFHEMDQLRKKMPVELPDQFWEFYTPFNGLSLPSFRNGYFLHPLNLILKSLSDPYSPREISGSIGDKIITIGSDGGGNLFAIRINHGDVLYLRHSIIENGIYDGEWMPPIIVSGEFNDFLIRILMDLEACVNDTKDWIYIDKLNPSI